jgi:hypothetical protein
MHQLRAPRLAAFAVAGLGLSGALPVWAWNDFGHMTVAAVAWQHLTPAARTEATKLLRMNPDYPRWVAQLEPDAREVTAFMRAATWPDASQNTGYDDPNEHRYWHYVDVPFSTRCTPSRASPGSCLREIWAVTESCCALRPVARSFTFSGTRPLGAAPRPRPWRLPGISRCRPCGASPIPTSRTGWMKAVRSRAGSCTQPRSVRVPAPTNSRLRIVIRPRSSPKNASHWPAGDSRCCSMRPLLPAHLDSATSSTHCDFRPHRFSARSESHASVQFLPTLTQTLQAMRLRDLQVGFCTQLCTASVDNCSAGCVAADARHVNLREHLTCQLSSALP